MLLQRYFARALRRLNEAAAALIPDRTDACRRFAVRAGEAISFIRDNTVFFITVYFFAHAN
jgi:hypothetical protein